MGLSDTTHYPSASTDTDVIGELVETVSYLEPSTPLDVDEHGLPVLEADPDDPDDE